MTATKRVYVLLYVRSVCCAVMLSLKCPNMNGDDSYECWVYKMIGFWVLISVYCEVGLHADSLVCWLKLSLLTVIGKWLVLIVNTNLECRMAQTIRPSLYLLTSFVFSLSYGVAERTLHAVRALYTSIFSALWPESTLTSFSDLTYS